MKNITVLIYILLLYIFNLKYHNILWGEKPSARGWFYIIGWVVKEIEEVADYMIVKAAQNSPKLRVQVEKR